MCKHNRAFTLIELLVVIAIIAILASILFPVFAQAKASAKTSVDLSNIKQLGTATALYLGDFDDTYPAARSTGNMPNGDSCGPVWTSAINPYVKAAGINNNNWDVATGSNIFHDPSDDRVFSQPAGTYEGYTANALVSGVFTQGANCASAPDDGNPNQPFQPSLTSTAVQNPADVFWIGDAAPVWFSWVNGGSFATVPTDLTRPVWDFPAATTQAAEQWYQTYWLPQDFTDGFIPKNHNPWDGCPLGSWACKGLDYIHGRSGIGTGGVELSFCDTHAKMVRFGQLKITNIFPNP
jgi:prepilin-type N-terminal cleavage/methylation domain-containing protein